ncbi:Ulvan-active sulfatase [subsurface metagenome]
MNRRDFLKKSSMVLGATSLADLVLPKSLYSRENRPKEKPARRGLGGPDVLFIAIEDIAPLMGCYGHPIVKTPNIDALAERGVLFNNAYCQVAVCNPSRACVSTGLRPETTGVFHNSIDWRRRIPKGTSALPEFFRDNGYETITCGKIHHGPRYFTDSSEQAQKREDRMWHKKLRARSRRYVSPAITPKAERPAWLKPDDYIARSLNWGPTGLKDAEQGDGATAQSVAEELMAKRDKHRKVSPRDRLYMAVGFHAPHYSLRAPDKYFNMYPPDKIILPKNLENDLADVPHEYSASNTTDDKWLNEDEKRQVIAAYYACISYIDTCVGILMSALKQAGRQNNTIVCLWGDHGMHLGEHFLWRKYTLFENAARVPFIIAAPGVAKSGPPNPRRAGAVCYRPVELIDIYPTLVDLCGLRIPKGLEGISMRPLLEVPGRTWKKAAFTSQNAKNRSLRTQKWRYTEWGSPENAELYDHENDPGEFTNLAKDPEHADTVGTSFCMQAGKQLYRNR